MQINLQTDTIPHQERLIILMGNDLVRNTSIKLKKQ